MWLLNGTPFTQEDVPDSAVGFVYMITNNITHKRYIGKKLFWRTKVRPPLKGKKRKRRERVASDWQDYCSSSDEVRSQIESLGLESFTREILHITESKGMLSYLELQEQVERRVLFDDAYLNGIIQVRINRKHLPSK